jgi:uncharacterized protein (TIRG00374 family)
MKKKLILSLAVGVLLSSVALFLAFRNVPFSELLSYLSTVQYAWVIPTILLVATAFLLRALRWQMILNTSSSVSFLMSYHPLTIGFMLNCILPGRLGEAARPLILKRKKGIPFTTGIATVAAERIFDAGFLIVFFAIALASIPLETAGSVSYGQYHLSLETLKTLGINLISLSLFLLVLILCIAIDRTRKFMGLCIDQFPEKILFFLPAASRERVRRSVAEPFNRLLGHAAEGLLLFKNPLKLAACSGVTLAIWFLTALSYYTMSLGCPGVDLSLYELSIMMVIICFFIALPSAPGYWGVWEAGGIFVLTLFGVSSNTAAGFTLTSHAAQLFPVVMMGLFSSLAMSINIRQISRNLRH